MARILVVEDEALLAATVCDWLDDAGFEVCAVAAEGPEAVRLARESRPDLAIVDLTLAGGTDGLATADELARRAGTPTLFLTAHRERLEDASCGLGWLAKPTTARALVEAVDQALAAAPAAPAASCTSPSRRRRRGDVPPAPAGAPVVPAEGESRFRAVFETAPHGIVTFDLELRIIDANLALGLMLGEDVGALVGRELAALDCIDAGVLEAAHACVAGCGDRILDREVTATGPDAATRHYRVAGTLVRGGAEEARYAVLHVLDLTAQRRAEAELHRLAWYDRLTGLANRASFESRLEHLRARAARAEVPLALLLLDLDDFKRVNDRFGHAAGDLLLRTVAGRIADRVRAVDTAARLGGDEFAVLLDGPSADGAVGVAEELVARLARPCAVAELEVSVGASVGVAWSADGDASADALLRRADVALYCAKGETAGGVRRG
ncbi:MAG: diguanylate cyclase [Alphaproteobacteria bacterium]|jgi:diguanylate cyclase (GGDEF)-like protein/PAS domain S-box-containing protein|nr:diguanylate cyclase [Alphaproteobacteria bacterium]